MILRTTMPYVSYLFPTSLPLPYQLHISSYSLAMIFPLNECKINYVVRNYYLCLSNKSTNIEPHPALIDFAPSFFILRYNILPSHSLDHLRHVTICSWSSSNNHIISSLHSFCQSRHITIPPCHSIRGLYRIF